MWQPGSPRDEPRSFITTDHRILNKCDIPEAEVFFENKTHNKSPRMRSPLDVCQVEPLFPVLPWLPESPVCNLGQVKESRFLSSKLAWTLIWPVMIYLRGPCEVAVEHIGGTGEPFQALILGCPALLFHGSSSHTRPPELGAPPWLTPFAFLTRSTCSLCFLSRNAHL